MRPLPVTRLMTRDLDGFGTHGVAPASWRPNRDPAKARVTLGSDEPPTPTRRRLAKPQLTTSRRSARSG